MRTRSVELVILELRETEYGSTHKLFPFLASRKDILSAPIIGNSNWARDLLSFAQNRLSLFVKHNFLKIFRDHKDIRHKEIVETNL